MPGSRLEILGILIDCTEARAWLTMEKRARIILDKDGALSNKHLPTVCLQSIVGSLLFVTRIRPGGRAFLRRVFDAATADPEPWSRIFGPLEDELRWWRRALCSWDGCTLLAHDLPPREEWTDAAPTVGLGGDIGPKDACADTFALSIPAKHKGKDSMFLEALALLIALRRWSSELRNREVTCFVDNAVLLSAIRSGSGRHQPTQTIIRKIFGLATAAHMSLTPIWVASADNDLADAMSRFDSAAARARNTIALLPTNSPNDISSSPITTPPNDWQAQVGGDLWHGLSNNTRRFYGNIPSQFVNFSRLRGWTAPFFPAPTWRVSAFVANAARLIAQRKGGLANSALKRLVTALRS